MSKERFRDKLYRYWLYCGPGMKGVRRALRINDQILPVKAEVRDAHFYGHNAVEAAHEVETLRDNLVEEGFTREYPRSGEKAMPSKDGEPITSVKVVVEPVTKPPRFAEGVDEDGV